MPEPSFTEPDQYGQSHPIENPDLISRKLKHFEDAVQEITKNEKENLVRAQEKCPELLTDDFKLMFLRCEVFNEKLAAKRYVKYWDKRVEIFGDKAFQPLTLSKALADDSVAFSFGVIRLTRTKDPSGRSILFFDPSRQDKTKYTVDSMTRTVWYIFHAALEDSDTQKHGVVMIGYPVNAKLPQFDRSLAKQITSSIKGCLPVRLSAVHICHPPTFFKIVFPILKLFWGERLRKRIRIHSGSEEHVLADLNKFGLDKDKLPTELGGSFVLDHEGWLKDRRSAGK